MFSNKRNKLDKKYFNEVDRIARSKRLLTEINSSNVFINQNEKNQMKRELSNLIKAAKDRSKGLKNQMKNFEKEEKQFKQLEQIMKNYMRNYNRNGTENVKVLTTKLRSVFNK